MARAHVIGVIAAWLLVGLLVFLTSDPPAARPLDAPERAFSAARAMEDVRGLTSSGKPHPAGRYDGAPRTAEEVADHTRAREFVESRLRALGLTPTVQRGNACRTWGDHTLCTDVENVVARIEGAEPGPAILLAAHYDSTPFGPGAADDGAGVATLLETVRALRADPPLRRPLVILIDDGEEMGLIGARVFVNEHPFAKDIGIVLNFEARGTRGQVAMFETSAENGALISLFGGAVDRPVASSVIYTMYKRLPNDTDLTVFKQAGMMGLNFAFANEVSDYHTESDTADALDPRSLQHMGDQALAVTRAFVSADALPARAPDSVYFDLFTLALVRYPISVGALLAALSLLATAAALTIAVKKARLSLRNLLVSLGLVLGALVLSVATGLGAGVLLRRIRFPRLDFSGPPMAVRMAMRALMGDRHVTAPWLALVALSAAVSLALLVRFCPKDRDGAADTGALRGGALILWTILSALLGFTGPAAAYLFTWTALFGAAALWLHARSDRPGRAAISVALVAIPAAILWFPMVRVFFIMVGATMPPAATAPVFLLATLVAPLFAGADRKTRWAPPIAAVGLFAIAFVIACVLK